MEKTIGNVQEMIEFGKQIGEKYKKILLVGELGAGKTHFVKGRATNFGDYEIISPSYTYMNRYENFLHIDMRRIENETDFLQLAILPFIEESENICIEWPKFEDLYVDESFIKIEIKKVDLTTRLVKITKC